jgi:hypothetical protein
MPPDSPRPGHHRRQPQPIDRRRLPAAPLVEAVRGYARRRQRPLDALMRPRLLQALQQAARTGQVTVLTGERVCEEVLGWHPRMVWGEHYDQVICDPTPHRGTAPTGTTTAYRGGCRCLDCREANAAARTGRHAPAREGPAREGGERSA